MKKDPMDYIGMMDDLAKSLCDTVTPKSKNEPVVIEDMVNAFKELAAWGVKRYDIINQTGETGIGGKFQEGTKGGGNERKGSPSPDDGAGILAQLGVRRKKRAGVTTSRLSPHIEGDSSDSSGVGTEQPSVLEPSDGIQPLPDSSLRPDMAENDSGGIIQCDSALPDSNNLLQEEITCATP